MLRTGPLNQNISHPPICCVISWFLHPLPFSHLSSSWKDDMKHEAGNSNHTVRAFPLNYLVMASFYRHKVYLWTLLKALYLAAVFQRVSLHSGSNCRSAWFFSVSRSGDADIKRQGVSWRVPSWKWQRPFFFFLLFVYFVPYTNKNALKMKPWCNDDLKRSDTLSHNIVLSNSPELPKRLRCKSRRNQMREKSITSLSPLSLPWLNYWNKMLHLEESLERQREKKTGEVGERETLLGTWVPFRLGPSSLRKPLKAENDPPSCPWLGGG